MSHSHIGVVTGANKGIGLAIVRQLALQYPTSTLSNNGASKNLLIYLTARDTSRGEAAVKALYEDDNQLKKVGALTAKGKEGGWAEIKFHQLDIRDTMSIRGFTDYLRKEHGDGGIDFVVNNAGGLYNQNVLFWRMGVY